jgi:hypothetical protein
LLLTEPFREALQKSVNLLKGPLIKTAHLRFIALVLEKVIPWLELGQEFREYMWHFRTDWPIPKERRDAVRFALELVLLARVIVSLHSLVLVHTLS